MDVKKKVVCVFDFCFLMFYLSLLNGIQYLKKEFDIHLRLDNAESLQACENGKIS